MHPSFHIDKPRVSPLRSMVKAIGYRVISASETMLLAWLIFGNVHLAASFGVVDMICNTALYYFHERLWAHIDLHLEKRRNGKH